MTVTWTVPSNTGSPITGYEVFYGTTGVPTTTFVVAASSAVDITITGLNANTTYFINVVAVNAAGNSVASVDVSTTTTNVVPAAPTIGTATPHLNSVTITWTAPTANGGSPITGYEVFFGLAGASGVKFGPTLSSATLTVDVTGLSAATSYNFYVVAINALGNGPVSGNATATTTNVVPNAPSGVTVTSPSLSSITVNWTAPTANGGSSITGYEVFYGTSADPTTKFGSTLGPLALSVEVTGLLPGTQYYFAVKVINAAGSSTASATLATVSTTNVVPGASLSVTVTPGLNNMTLAWTAPTANGGTAITGYRIYNVVGGSAVLLATVGNVTQYLDPDMVSGDVRTYRISAFNAQGESGLSDPISGAALYPPAPPTGLTVIRDGRGIVLTWIVSSGNDTSSPNFGYAIYRGTTSGGEVLIDVVGASAVSYVDTNTSSTQTYYYRVAALPGPSDQNDQLTMSVEVVQPGVPNNTDWTLMIGIPIVLIVFFFFIFILFKRRKKKEDEEDGKKKK